MPSQRYPENEMPIAAELAERYERFAVLREEFVLDYGYNTARAYWDDLQHIYEWAVERDKDVLALTEKDLKQYCALLRRRKYSESTVRRRLSIERRFLFLADSPTSRSFPGGTDV